MSKISRRPKRMVHQPLNGSITSVNTLIEEIRETNTVITWPLKNYSKIKEKEVEKVVTVSSRKDKWKFILKISQNKLKITLLLDVFNERIEFGIRKSDGQIFTDISCERYREDIIVAVIENKTILDPENKLLNNDILIMQWIYTARRPENNMVLLPGLQSTCYDLMQNCDMDSLCSDLRDLYLSSRFHDFLINFNGVEFKVHKFILCARSSYFERLEGFYPGFASEQILHDVDPCVMHEVLLYMYSGLLKDMHVYDMIDVYDVACFLEIQSLIEECINFFKANFCVRNSVGILKAARKNESEELEKEVTAFMERQPISVLQSDEWSDVLDEIIMLGVE